MTVLLHHDADKYLDRLNATDRERVKEALRDLAKEPPEGDIEPITGQRGTFRLRIGSYRAIFRYKNDCIFVTHLDPRGQVYKKKNKGNKR